jgi:hypothetical protein
MKLGWGATITRVVKPFSFPLTSHSSAVAGNGPLLTRFEALKARSITSRAR